MLTKREIFISIVDNDLVKESDAIILLEGDGLNRYQHAIQLYREKLASIIVFSGGIVDYKYGSYPYEEIKPLILEHGVPESVLIHESKSQNTKQQADEIIEMAKENKWERIILVASSYHQYRAYLTFLKSLTDSDYSLLIYNSPVSNLKWFEENVWGSRFDCLEQEFERIDKYQKFGHLATYENAIEYQKWKEKF